jgi:hypothetical protein
MMLMKAIERHRGRGFKWRDLPANRNGYSRRTTAAQLLRTTAACLEQEIRRSGEVIFRNQENKFPNFHSPTQGGAIFHVEVRVNQPFLAELSKWLTFDRHQAIRRIHFKTKKKPPDLLISC